MVSRLRPGWISHFGRLPLIKSSQCVEVFRLAMRSMKFTQLCQLGTSYDLSSMERARSANSSQVEIGGSIRKRSGKGYSGQCAMLLILRDWQPLLLVRGVAQVQCNRGLRMHSHSFADRWLDSQWQIVSSACPCAWGRSPSCHTTGPVLLGHQPPPCKNVPKNFRWDRLLTPRGSKGHKSPDDRCQSCLLRLQGPLWWNP